MFNELANFSGFDIIVNDSVKGDITIKLSDVPWDQALDIILKNKNLARRQNGKVITIGTAEEISKQELEELNLKKQYNELGPLRSELIPLNYANAEEMQKILKEKNNSMMSQRGSITFDKRTNTLLLQDIDSKIGNVRALIQRLDVPVRQVEISTQIITTDNIFEKTFGIRFGGGSNVAIGQRRLGIGSTMDRARATGDFGTRVPPSNVDFTGATPINSNIIRQPLVALAPGPQVNNTEGLFSDLGAALITPGQTAAIGRIGLALARLPNGTLLDLELQALELESKTKTIARPKLLTMDGAKAFVEKGVQIPYQESSSSGATSVSFKPAVLRLEVTPHITPDDKVFMDLNITNDTQGAGLPVQTSANGISVVTNIPIINSNKLETQVLVDNGETIVLGGIFQINDQKRFQKIPFFGDLPFIGGMFRNYDIFQNPQELIIFITPKIVKPLYGCG
jgi:type IV pilus assembly protein PilQ